MVTNTNRQYQLGERLIISPLERHLKGTVTALVHYNMIDLVDDPRFLSLWKTAIFDLHSYPVYISFGENINKIDWLVLDHPKISGNKLTIKFLNDHGIAITEQDIKSENISSSKSVKKQLVEKLRILRGTAKLGTLTYFYDTDEVLYTKVMEKNKFELIDSLHWDQCSWLAK